MPPDRPLRLNWSHRPAFHASSTASRIKPDDHRNHPLSVPSAPQISKFAHESCTPQSPAGPSRSSPDWASVQYAISVANQGAAIARLESSRVAPLDFPSSELTTVSGDSAEDTFATLLLDDFFVWPDEAEVDLAERAVASHPVCTDPPATSNVIPRAAPVNFACRSTLEASRLPSRSLSTFSISSLLPGVEESDQELFRLPSREEEPQLAPSQTWWGKEKKTPALRITSLYPDMERTAQALKEQTKTHALLAAEVRRVYSHIPLDLYPPHLDVPFP